MNEISNPVKPGKKSATVTQIKQPRFKRIPLRELAKQHPGATPMLIRNYLPAKSIITLYGDYGSFKTTIVSDMVGCIDTGIPWRDNKVNRGIVWYIAAEDPTGVRLRFEVWYKDKGLNFEESTNVEIINEPICFADMESVNEFITDVNSAINKPILIVIDTMSDIADKYSLNSDMGLFMRGFEKFRNETGCSILIIHHCGHVAKDRPRNGSELGGKSDVIAQVRCENDVSTLTYSKVKNGSLRDAKPLSWTPKVIETKWADNDGNVITSVTVDPTDKLPDRPKPLGPKQQRALEVLKTLYREHQNNLAATGHDPATARVLISDWEEAMTAVDSDSGNRSRTRKSLIGKYVEESGCYVIPL